MRDEMSAVRGSSANGSDSALRFLANFAPLLTSLSATFAAYQTSLSATFAPRQPPFHPARAPLLTPLRSLYAALLPPLRPGLCGARCGDRRSGRLSLRI